MPMTIGLNTVFDEMQKMKMVQILTNARQNRLAVKMRNFEGKELGSYVDLSLKVWDVLSGLWDISTSVAAIATAASSARMSLEAIEAIEYAKQASFLAAGGGDIMEAVTVGEVMEVAGPLVAWIAMWVNLGSPYLEIKEQIQKESSRRGVAHGILVACQRRSAQSARHFGERQPEPYNNVWLNDATAVAQNSYRMGFIAGYFQGHELTESQKHIFWKIFGRTLKEGGMGLWDGLNGDQANDAWIWEAGGHFQKKHLTDA